MRFLIDMPLTLAVARWLSSQSHDAVHAGNLGPQCAPDADIVDRGRQEGRTVVTADPDDPRFLALTQVAEPSLILSRHGGWSEADVIARLSGVLAHLSETGIAQSIPVLDRDQVRRRRLPIG